MRGRRDESREETRRSTRGLKQLQERATEEPQRNRRVAMEETQGSNRGDRGAREETTAEEPQRSPQRSHRSLVQYDPYHF